MSVTIYCVKHGINMTNRNFGDFMAYLEVSVKDSSPDLIGTITPEESKAFIIRILDILADGSCALLEEPTLRLGSIIEVGRDARYIHDRLQRLLCIFSDPVVHNKEVNYS